MTTPASAPPSSPARQRRSAPSLSAALLLVGLTIPACEPAPPGPGTDPAPDQPVSFANDIRPLLRELCVNCHHQGALMGNLNLENRQLAMRPREGAPLLVPGEPDQSRFYQVLNLPADDPSAMPPTGHHIEDGELALFRRWIEQGAQWPDGPDGAVPPLAPITEDVSPEPGPGPGL